MTTAPPNTPPQAIRTWIENWEYVAAVERQRAGQCEPLPAARSFALALDLIDLLGQRAGWPPPEDAVAARSRRAAEDAWARLRSALGAG